MKKLILAATVLALAGMNLQNAKADVSISIGFGGTAGGFVAVHVPTVCPPPVHVYRPPVVCAPPVVIVRPRPVCEASERFVAIRGDCRDYGRGNWCDGPRREHHRFGRDRHHYR